MFHKIKIIVSITVIALLVLLTISENIFKTNKKLCFDDISDLPENKVGLLLGTSKYLKKDKQNLFYKNRIDAAAKLYYGGKIEFIIASGDNRYENYNEPKIMKSDLIKRGIPSDKIYSDFAGFRTFDSVIRSKKIFGQTKITVISQRFHNLRAVFIAKHFGIDAVAYNAKEVKGIEGIKTRFRELFARIKALSDIYILQTKPKFLGKKIKIGK